MSPYDQNSNAYYDNTNANNQAGQSEYARYQSNTNPSYQHIRQTSASATPQPYNVYQQHLSAGYNNSNQSQVNSNSGWSRTDSDRGTRAAETLSRMGTSNVEQTRHAGTTHSNSASTYQYGSDVPSYSHAQSMTTHTPEQDQAQYSAQYSAPVQTHALGYASHPPRPPSQPQVQNQARSSGINSVRSNTAAQRTPANDPSNTRPPTQQYQRTHMSDALRSASPAQIQASLQLQNLQTEGWQPSDSSTSAGQSFVDLSAVYDPQTEYQRKLEAVRAAEERLAAEREAERRRREEEEAEEATRVAEEQARQDEMENENKKELAAIKRAKDKERRKSKAAQKKAGVSATDISAAGMDLSQLHALADQGGDAEAQIRQLMAMVKKLNDKHPALLAKIWEQERQQHAGTEDEVEPPSAAPAEPAKTQKKRAPKIFTSAFKAPGSASKASASTLIASASGTKTPTSMKSAQAPVKSSAKARTKASPAVPAVSTAPAPTAAAPPKPASPNVSAKAAPKAATKSGTFWAPEQKGQLAAFASAWLNAVPENKNRAISTTPLQLIQMLNSTPTYEELCGMVEKLGMKVDRGAFAKALLTNKPALNSKQPSPAVPRPASIPGQSAFPPPSHSPWTPLSMPPESQGNIQPLHPSNFAAPTTISPSVTVYGTPLLDDIRNDAPTVATTKSKSNQPRQQMAGECRTRSERPSETPGPLTKADAARKRTFADLIDLTNLSDDDLPPAKQTYFGPPPVRNPGVAYETGLWYDKNPPSRSVIDPYLDPASQRQRWPGGPSRIYGVTGYCNPPPADSLIHNPDLVKQISRNNAVRRSSYDVRTIARDILLATGRHPDLLPLNGHLETLRSMFPRSFDMSADLSTIRWDLIDPGDPISSAFDTVRNDDKDSVIDDADDEVDEEWEQVSERRAPPQFISVGGDANGSTPTPHNFSNYQYKPQLLSNKSRPIPSGGRGRGRGRPRLGIHNSAGIIHQSPAGNHNPNSSTPRDFTTSSLASASGGTGYSAFNRELRPDGTKKRGRPVGWRKSIHGRGGGTPGSGTPTTPASVVKFPVFRCGWEGCNAGLHNLDTLRRHVKKIHGNGDKSGKFTCFWEVCGKDVQLVDAETGAITHLPQRFNFPDGEELMKHVNAAHLGPIAWKSGDGPAAGFAESNVSDAEPYLSDHQGRRVTPQIHAAAPPRSELTSADPTPARRGRPPKKTAEESARESQAELAKRKREIGLGVDRQGATFANEKRRAGFVDDEDDAEVMVEDSD